MKLLDIFAIINEAQFLVERDVVNAKELKAWAKESAARLTDPQAATWYASQLFKFLINRYEAGARQAQIDDNSPEWMVAKAQAGEPIISIEPQQELRQQAEQVIDWLNAQTAENESPNLRMTWEDAVEAQAEWHKDIARQSRVTELTADQMGGIVTIMEFDDGFRWVDVQTEVCLQHEGTIMGHCVGQGGYTEGVSEGTTKILSLRDGNNNPHATIEGTSEHPIVINADMLNSGQADLFLDNALEQSFVDMAISQIKGKENKPVVRKYRDYVQEFLTKFQINSFGHNGLNDLENCGLFKLKDGGFSEAKGGYANTEEVGEVIATMDDGTSWHRVDTEYVELASSYSHEQVHGKWFLFDKTGRSIGDMTESRQSYGGSVITRISFNSVSIHGYKAADMIPYKDHIITAFNSKYDKNRSGIRPDSDLHRLVGSPLTSMELGVRDNKVNQPQTVGSHKGTTSAGEIYETESGGDSNFYWLMQGDKIVSLFTMEKKNTENFKEYPLHFDDKHGLPSGSMTKFLKEFAALFPGDININYIMVRDRAIMVRDIEWQPEEGNDEFIMEEDGVKFYQNRKGWYNATDAHGHHIFNMHTGNPSFKLRMVADPKIAGYYAVYLIDRQELDIGDYTDYSSFAREFLEETDWFEGRNSTTWYVIDETFPIHMIEEHTYDDDTEENVTDEDTTMKHYWDENNMYDSGVEPDYFAGEYEQVYRGGNIGHDDEHGPSDPDEEFQGRQHIRTDYYVEGIGNADTVTHPVSGGTVRVQK
jgi:hypothetical protein